jgi:dolichol kinase
MISADVSLMIDLALAAAWIVLVGGVAAACVALRRAGVALTYLRDLVHVGAGLWVLAWPLWRRPAAPIAFALCGAAAAWMVPLGAGRLAAVGRFRDSISDATEPWNGIGLYGLSFAAFTAAAFAATPFPAGAALLALAIGDGIGGLVGRRYGRHFFTAPGAKRKSLEGSATVALGAAAAVLVSALRFGARVEPGPLLASALAAAIVEAVAPQGTDNVLIPAAVWLVLVAGQGGAS